MSFIIEHEGPFALFKGIGPQITKGLLVQGLLMMTKERMELLFVMLFAYVRLVREKQLKKVAEAVRQQADKAADVVKSQVSPMAEQVVEKAKEVLPVVTK